MPDLITPGLRWDLEKCSSRRGGLVKNIFMEVTVRTDSHFKACEQALDVIVHAGYHLAGQGGYLGPGHTNPWPDDEQLVSNILTAAHKEKSNQLNLWWVLSA